MNEFLTSLLRRFAGSYIESLIELAKVEAAIMYLNGVKTARRILILFCLLVFCVVVLACGFLIVPIALCMFMPWSPETKAIVAIAFGAVYILVPLIIVISLMSEKRWVKAAGVEKLLKSVKPKEKREYS